MPKISRSKPFKISHSKAKVGRRCQKAYYYKYILKLKKKTKSRPLMIGSLVHESIESYIKTGFYMHKFKEFREETFRRLNVEEQALNADIFDLCKSLVRGWILRWNSLGWEMEWVEKEFEVEIAPGVLLIGKIDGRAKDREGRSWLYEHKTCKRMPDELVRMYDVQTPLYISVLPEIKEPPVVGVLWDYIRTKMPAKPELLKSGGLSMRKSIDTLPEIYAREVKRHGYNLSGYSDIIDSLKLNEENFYRRIQYPVSKPQALNLREELMITVRYLQDLEEKGEYCRNLTRDCGWCDFKDLCYAELRGDDTEFLMKYDFEVKDDKEKGSERDIGEGEAGD
ncbi:PD-(D/E)XK nuclease [Serratia phage Serbin]|uniref:PD-(D/E)XK nuclease n=1 Tax=Serratia phage Serbin TaxID=2562181 RepID=A0A482MIW4_9CAUD|nr:PD-(D/E)XK nuclease [Serratia phage Serbin]QBQ72963.1 PD-(D/E)XK nuclease [Serratia phage Serbin]